MTKMLKNFLAIASCDRVMKRKQIVKRSPSVFFCSRTAPNPIWLASLEVTYDPFNISQYTLPLPASYNIMMCKDGKLINLLNCKHLYSLYHLKFSHTTEL